MSRPAFVRTHAADIREIVGAIYALTMILEGDAFREDSDGEEAALGRFEQGGINTAIKQLTLRAECLAEAIEERAE